jgi:hypothetical protein
MSNKPKISYPDNPPAGYRFLLKGETARGGDSVVDVHTGEFAPTDPSYGDLRTVGMDPTDMSTLPWARPITLKAPAGWRVLEWGETIQADDFFLYGPGATPSPATRWTIGGKAGGWLRHDCHFGFIRRVAPDVASPSVKAGNGIDRSKVTLPTCCRELLDGEVILPTDRFLDGKGWRSRAGTKSCGKPYRRDVRRITVRRTGDRLASEGLRLLTAGEKVQADDVFLDGYGCATSIKPMSHTVGILADGWIKPDDRCEYRWARRIAAVPAPAPAAPAPAAPAPAAPAPAAPAPAAPAPAPRSFHVCVGLGEASASVPRFDGRILIRIDSSNGLNVALPLTRMACQGLVTVLTKALESR